MALYHQSTGIPKNLRLPKSIRLSYSLHAQRQAQARGVKNLPSILNILPGDLIEVEAYGVDVVKATYRIDHTLTTDLILAVSLPDGVVKTCWENHYKDQHSTLDTSKYTRL